MIITTKNETTTPLRTDIEAAEILNLAPQTLRNWRFISRGPAWIKLGRAIRYRQQDLDEYLEKNRITVVE